MLVTPVHAIVQKGSFRPPLLPKVLFYFIANSGEVISLSQLVLYLVEPVGRLVAVAEEYFDPYRFISEVQAMDIEVNYHQYIAQRHVFLLECKRGPAWVVLRSCVAGYDTPECV